IKEAIEVVFHFSYLHIRSPIIPPGVVIEAPSGRSVHSVRRLRGTKNVVRKLVSRLCVVLVLHNRTSRAEVWSAVKLSYVSALMDGGNSRRLLCMRVMKPIDAPNPASPRY